MENKYPEFIAEKSISDQFIINQAMQIKSQNINGKNLVSPPPIDMSQVQNHPYKQIAVSATSGEASQSQQSQMKSIKTNTKTKNRVQYQDLPGSKDNSVPNSLQHLQNIQKLQNLQNMSSGQNRYGNPPREKSNKQRRLVSAKQRNNQVMSQTQQMTRAPGHSNQNSSVNFSYQQLYPVQGEIDQPQFFTKSHAGKSFSGDYNKQQEALRSAQSLANSKMGGRSNSSIINSFADTQITGTKNKTLNQNRSSKSIQNSQKRPFARPQTTKGANSRNIGMMQSYQLNSNQPLLDIEQIVPMNQRGQHREQGANMNQYNQQKYVQINDAPSNEDKRVSIASGYSGVSGPSGPSGLSSFTGGIIGRNSRVRIQSAKNMYNNTRNVKILDEADDDTLQPEDVTDAHTQHRLQNIDERDGMALPGGLTQAQYLALNKKDMRMEITYKKNLEMAQRRNRRQFSTGGIPSESSSKLNVKNLKAQEIVTEINRIQSKNVKKVGDFHIVKQGMDRGRRSMNIQKSGFSSKQQSLVTQLDKYQKSLRNGSSKMSMSQTNLSRRQQSYGNQREQRQKQYEIRQKLDFIDEFLQNGENNPSQLNIVEGNEGYQVQQSEQFLQQQQQDAQTLRKGERETRRTGRNIEMASEEETNREKQYVGPQSPMFSADNNKKGQKPQNGNQNTQGSENNSVIQQVQHLNQAYDEMNKQSFGESSVNESRNPKFENMAVKKSFSKDKKKNASSFKVIEPKEFKISFDRQQRQRPQAEVKRGSRVSATSPIGKTPESRKATSNQRYKSTTKNASPNVIPDDSDIDSDDEFVELGGSKSQILLKKEKANRYKEVIKSVSQERSDIGRLLARLQDEKFLNDDKIEKNKDQIVNMNQDLNSTHLKSQQLLVEKQHRMEDEYVKLQHDYKDQIENINVNTHLELEKLQPILQEVQTERKTLQQELDDIRKERENLQSQIRARESQNDKLMQEYCQDKKTHYEQIIETTKRADIQDQYEPTDMAFALVRQQKEIAAYELKNKALCDEHESFQEYILDLEKQKLMSAEYRYKLVDMMGELYRYIQPSQLDKVMLVEMEQRERARELLHETLKAFEGASEGGDLDFKTLQIRMDKVYSKLRAEKVPGK